MKLGTNERGKVIALGVLLLVAGYLVYSNVISQPSTPSAPASRPPAIAQAPDIPAVTPPVESARPVSPRAPSGRGRNDEFRPVLPGHSKRADDRIDPGKIDPTLRLDLLAKLEQVEPPGSGRNLFQVGPPPKKEEPLKGKEPIVPLAAKKEDTKPAEPPKPPTPPPPPPINLKYYGFSSAPGSTTKTAFFLDGEDILVAREGETLKRRYRLVRIGVNSVVMEDTDSKRQQTIPLTEEAG
ncbi:MAG: hypothetical protein C5B51_18365 [Terriglobia bacterium]|nr:MAG: hypothetical protein C5B51_18365 [Terriglobia bacterium]